MEAMVFNRKREFPPSPSTDTSERRKTERFAIILSDVNNNDDEENIEGVEMKAKQKFSLTRIGRRNYQ